MLHFILNYFDRKVFLTNAVVVEGRPVPTAQSFAVDSQP